MGGSTIQTVASIVTAIFTIGCYDQLRAMNKGGESPFIAAVKRTTGAVVEGARAGIGSGPTGKA
jgi:hypothetical protein